MTVLKIGTRGSALALWQANHVAALLRTQNPSIDVELVIIKTKGDKILDVPLAKVGGKGLFVKELEQALVEGAVDLAVHSMKDVPAELQGGLTLAAIPPREDPRDALVSRGGTLFELARGALVGTSSLRRRCQLLALRGDLRVEDLRGNVDTRIGKLDAGTYDAIVLAAAGLKRLQREQRVTEFLASDRMIPAVGQGALGIETREADRTTRELLRGLHDEPTSICVRAERALLAQLGGGCQVPVAGHAVLDGESLLLNALVGHPSGSPIHRVNERGLAVQAAMVGQRAGQRLLDAGGAAVLAEVYGSSSGQSSGREMG